MSPSPEHPPSLDISAPLGVFAPAMDYMIDAAQRSVLFWDTMRRRGNQYRAHLAETVPHVLDFAGALLVDGRTLARPGTCALATAVPPHSVHLAPARRRD